MPLNIRMFPYGNLQAYKMHIRPNIYQILFGKDNDYKKIPKNKHAENIIQLLAVLSRHGTCTTWQIAKKENRNNIERLRTKEKIYRRLIIGRDDKKKHNQGLLEQSLVIQDGVINHQGGTASQYRLSLHGILCCIDVLDLDNKQIDILAAMYASILPKVFGRWDFLRSVIGKDVYKIRILARGIISDNLVPFRESDFLMSEIMSYIHEKYKHKFENIAEEELAEQIALWFYTNLLYTSVKNSSTKKRKNAGKVQFGTKLAEVLSKDTSLKKWYGKFLSEIKKYHKMQYFTIKGFKIS